MSNRTYDELLREVLVELREQIEYEKPPDPAQLPKDKLELQKFYITSFSELFIKYKVILKKLEACYDQILQPQKREDVRLILESTIGRILEIKKILIDIGGDFMDFDEVLVDLKQTPAALEMTIPRYFLEENEKEIKRRDILIDILLQRHNIQTANLLDKDDDDKNASMTIQQAVLIIQTNERGRQGRHQAKYRREVKLRDERVRRVVELGEMQVDMEQAATKIQKVYRGYLARRLTLKSAHDEAEFLGMIPPPPLRDDQNPLIKLKGSSHKRKLIQNQNSYELTEQRVLSRKKIIEEEGEKMKEEMHDAILEQVILFRQESATNGIPEFPSEAEGGSKMFMQKIDQANKEAIASAEAQAKAAEEEKNNPKGKGKGKPPAKPAAKPGAKKTEVEEKKETMFDFEEFKFDIANSIVNYLDQWSDKLNPLDFNQKYDPEMLRGELMKGEKGIEEELRKQVDNVTREELNNLTLQIESENPVKAKGAKGKGAKGAKGKGKGKDKPKAEKSEPAETGPNGGKKTEPFLSELVFLEVIKKYPKDIKLGDYIGCHRLMGSILEDWYEPSMGQVREAIAELVLPLGSQTIHEKAPHYKAVLLYGPEKSGKTMLTYAMANSVAATFIDLSPNTIAGKYEGAKETSILVKMAFEVARDMQPAIIYIDDFDWVLKGKGKGKAKKGGIRLKKELLAQVKLLKKGERIMVVANCREPWDGDQAAFISFFQRMIYTAIPDYGSIHEMWKQSLEKKMQQPLPNNFDLSSLSYISSGFASGSIVGVVKKVLTDRRIKRLDQRPLETSEFIGHMAKCDPVYLKVDQKFRGFVEKLPQKLRKRTKSDIEKDKQKIAEEKAQQKPTKAKK
jgi:hypothetical protein